MNAIIMAAGLGSRFKEMTKHQHKSLLPIQGKPNLERTIEFLNDAGITEIHIITGHLAELFSYLPRKFPGITLHHNNKYQEYNSIYTFMQTLDFFGDSFVIDADTVIAKNIFQPFTQSTYLTINRQEEGVEWCPVTNAQGQVVEMKITAEKRPTMSGISFWSKGDAQLIKKALLADFVTEEILANSKLYWDNVPITLFEKLHVGVHQLAADEVYEMDNQEEYYRIREKLQ